MNARIYIVVEGGNVQSVFSSDPTVRVMLVDHDNAERGTPDKRLVDRRVKTIQRGLRYETLKEVEVT